MDGMLTPEERRELITQVAVFMNGNPANLTVILPEQHCIRIPGHDVSETYASNVIDYCERSAWMEDPPLIILLLQYWEIVDDFGFAAAISRIEKGRPSRYHLVSQLWNTIAVKPDLPFMGRKKTRAAIRSFSDPLQPNPVLGRQPGTRVLIINGPPKSGKTFTYDFIRYIDTFSKDFNLVFIDLKKQVNSRITPLDLTHALLNEINPSWREEVELPVQDMEQAPRWTLQLCMKIVEQVYIRFKPFIFIIDGFDDPVAEAGGTGILPFPAETLGMLLQLADIAAGKIMADECCDLIRVVLLGFTQPLTAYRGRIKTELIEPLKKEDIKTYLSTYAALHQQQPDIQTLDAMADKVMEGADPANPDTTKLLAQRAFALASNFFNATT